jgi:hypothetical protein
MTVQERFNAAIADAEQAFWSSIADSYPEIKTGDMSLSDALEFQLAMETALQSWITANSEVQNG